MTEEISQRRPSLIQEFKQEFPGVWKAIPDKGLFVILISAWFFFFDYFGNSTFGYIDTRSLFGWAFYSYECSEDDKHGLLMPFVVLILFWMKREKFARLPKSNWWPGLFIVAAALLLHLAGYFIQQTRFSLAAMFLGIYGLIGVVWGRKVLVESFFPMCLFAFALPLATIAETVTFPLRMLATKLSVFMASDLLGISVLQTGTQISDPSGAFQYEVAAACSGLRSLTAILALSTIWAFMGFTHPVKRMIMIASAFPLAVAGNVLRLSSIIIVSDAFGQKYGQWIHDSAWFSLLPYIPAFAGLWFIAWLLRDKTDKNRPPGPIAIQPPTDRKPDDNNPPSGPMVMQQPA